MSSMSRYLAQPYTFYSNRVRKVRDTTGVVHETFSADGVPFGRRTYCESNLWHLFEPLNTCDETEVTTCISCLGMRRDG
jgi:hypothetical protein